VKEDYTREVLGVYSIPGESTSGWQGVLHDIKQRGVEKIGLMISDNLSGLDRVISLIYRNTEHQKCVIHFKRNLLNKVESKHKKEVTNDLKEVFNLDLTNDTTDESALTLLSKVAMDKEDGYMKYPIYV